MLTIIIPIYNEESNLENLFGLLIPICENKNWNIIAINDGSSDNTQKILEKYKSENLSIIKHRVNKGYGAAIKTGIESANTKYCITFDADGQHDINDIEKLLFSIINNEADMVVGSRKNSNVGTTMRKIGKFFIRNVAKLLMPIKIYDINSGMKLFNSRIAKQYLHLYPDSMSFSDIICLVFIHNKYFVIEEQINVNKRLKGKSTINLFDAITTFYEIINIVMLFNPMKIFLPIAIVLLLSGLLWGIKFFLLDLGISIGSSLLIISGLIIFLIGLIAEQMSSIRKNQ